jgi:predicted PP-loop superfamily ATPase
MLVEDAGADVSLRQDNGLTALELASARSGGVDSSRSMAAIVRFLSLRTSGTVEMTVVSGSNLRVADAGGRSDPYVVVDFADVHGKSLARLQ